MTQAAVFLDRDGVLNPLVLNPGSGRMESPLSPEQFRLIDGVIPALLRLREAGYPLILVSNQPNLALGKCSLETLGQIHQKLVTELLFAGIRFARFCYCLHHPKGVTPGYSGLCVCRKPSPWFLLRARDDLGLSLRRSWMIGDQPTDIQCGHAAGVRAIRIAAAPADSGAPPSGASPAAPDPDHVAPNLAESVDIILAHRAY
jgi:D-glycero-D-manno-heptose 1,7-bisphosphate phosphatase